MAYTVEGKKIFATVSKLSTKDLKAIKNYVALGFELVDVKPPKLTQEEKAARAKENKAAKEKAAKENPYSKQNVEAFLKLPENAELLKVYKARYDEQAGTNRKGKDKIDEPKYLKDGKPKKKGYANCIGWFCDMFKYDEITKKYTRIEKK